MLKSKLYQKLLVASIVGTMCVSSGAMAFASTVKSTKNVTTKTATSKVKPVKGTKIVSTTGLTSARPVGGSAIQKGNPVTTILAAQVTAGVITQVEADSISAYITAEEATIKAKLSTMTDAEKKAYFESNKITKDSVFAQLVTAGLLTQAQATTIEASLPTSPAGGGKTVGKDKQKGASVAEFLAAQVTAGTITQAVSDNITTYYATKEATAKAARTAEKAKVAAMTATERIAYEATQKATREAKQAADKVTRDAEKAKLAAMTDAEKTAYLAANKASRPSIFAELVTAGILTQTQADALQAAMPKGPQKGSKPLAPVVTTPVVTPVAVAVTE